MTGKILDGKKVSVGLRETLSKAIKSRQEQGINPPCLAVILVGKHPASKIYVNNKILACRQVGIKSISYDLANTTSTEELLELVEKLNHDQSVDGILVQLPLPKQIDANLIIEKIAVTKDVDGFHPYNIGKLTQATQILRPCTPYGIIQLLAKYNINIKGINAVVVGASNIVGRPMALELLAKNATVTVCHSYTKNLPDIVKTAELLIVATGNPHIIKANWLKKDVIIIDVGINRMPDGTIVGDVEFNKALEVVKYITPVPGGIGPMTIVTLLQNTLLAQKLKRGAFKS